MQMKYLVKNDVRKNHLLASEITSKKVDKTTIKQLKKNILERLT